MELSGGYVLHSKSLDFIIKEETAVYGSNREFKDGVFRLLFSQKDTALELMNALEATDHTATEDMEIVTLERALYNRMLNDLAFRHMLNFLSIVEHQSKWSENMPLRELIYLGRVYEKILSQQKAFQTTLYRIPSPHFYVLYNGREDRPMEVIQHLEDAFLLDEDHPSLNMTVKIININYDKNHPVLQRSRTLREYAQFIARVRQYVDHGMTRDDAISSAIHSCIKDGILKDFLQKHGSEVYNMLFSELTYEDMLKIEVAEATEIAAREAAREAASERELEHKKLITKMLLKNIEIEEIHELTEVPMEKILRIKRELRI